MGGRLLFAIFLGGAGGGLARAALEREWPADGHSWPWVTFAVNIAGTGLGAAYGLGSIGAGLLTAYAVTGLVGGKPAR